MDNLGGPVEVGLRFPREKVRVRERGASQVALVVKNPPASVGDIRDVGLIPGSEDPLKEGMAPHSSILAWIILWTEEPDGLQSKGRKESDTTEQLSHTCTQGREMEELPSVDSSFWLSLWGSSLQGLP